MKIDWTDEVANNHKHHLNVALWQTGISQRDFAAICTWAASIVLSRVEEGVRKQVLTGRYLTDEDYARNNALDDVLSLLESMKQNTNGDQG